MTDGVATSVPRQKCHRTSLYVELSDHQWPIVYAPEYCITLCGLEKLQAYDTCKGANILSLLKAAGVVDSDTIVQPREPQREDLLLVHSQNYLDNLKWRSTVAGLSELPPVALLPNFLIDSKVLRPLRYQTGGTVLALRLAVTRGWSINLGGGFHHCSSNRGGGFCAYADVTLAIRMLFNEVTTVSRLMIIDLDASQGNGVERDFMDDDRVYVFDMYNRRIYPQDGFAKRGIDHKVELQPGTDDEEYLQLLRTHLDDALNEFTPDVVLYMAGCSILSTDVTGGLAVTPQGVIERDQIVVQRVRTRGIPVCILTAGGYTRTAASVTAQSIVNLYHVGLINGPASAVFPSVNSISRCGVQTTSAVRQSDEPSVWSRLRSMSIANFMSPSLPASTTAPLSTTDTDTLPDSTQVPPVELNDSCVINDAATKHEMSRCVSLPNIKRVSSRNGVTRRFGDLGCTEEHEHHSSDVCETLGTEDSEDDVDIAVEVADDDDDDGETEQLLSEHCV